MLEKTPLKGTEVRVTFRMPPMDGAAELYLCGEFNDWHTTGTPLQREADGSWTVGLLLQAGKSYRFRYRDNQGRWYNDWDADAFVPNAFGTEDSVVDLVAPLNKVSHQREESGGRRRSSGIGTEARNGSGAGRRSSAGRRPGGGQRPGGRPDARGRPGGEGRPGGRTGTGGQGPGARPGGSGSGGGRRSGPGGRPDAGGRQGGGRPGDGGRKRGPRPR